MCMGGYCMGLQKLEEPYKIKEFIRNVRQNFGSTNNIDYDSLAVWSFNKLQKFLWDNWKPELKQMGIRWQLFLKILKLHTDDFIKWALYDKMSWDEVIERVISTIEQYAER